MCFLSLRRSLVPSHRLQLSYTFLLNVPCWWMSNWHFVKHLYSSVCGCFWSLFLFVIRLDPKTGFYCHGKNSLNATFIRKMRHMKCQIKRKTLIQSSPQDTLVQHTHTHMRTERQPMYSQHVLRSVSIERNNVFILLLFLIPIKQTIVVNCILVKLINL